ncbi:MAG: S9 family peptidase [Thermomicrobiales bacterium]
MQHATTTRTIDPEILLRGPRLGTAIAVSPDGTQVVFTWNRDGQFQLCVVPVAGGAVRQLTDDADAAQMPDWTPDSQSILFRRDHDGDENTNLLLIPAAGGDAHRITDNAETVDGSPSFTPDGRTVVFGSNGDGPYHIYRVSVDGGRPQQLTRGEHSELAVKVSPDGSRAAFARRVPAGVEMRAELGILDLSSGTERLLGTFGVHNAAPHWSPDGTTILFTDDSSGFQQVILVDAKTGAVTPLSPPTNDTVGGGFSHDGRSAVYLENRDGNLIPIVHDLASGERRAVTAFPDGAHTDPELTADGTTLICIYNGPQHPADIWAIPLDGGAPRQLTESLPEGIARDALVRPELVRYPSFDGRMIPAWFYRPRGVERAPAIILVHGGPTGQTMNGWSVQVQFFVSRGYAVLAPNNRGSTGYGKEYRDANIRDWGGGDLRDLVAGHQWLAESGAVDPARIGVTGGSYGGYMTLIAMTKTPDVWAAGVSVVGMSNLRTLHQTTRKGDLLPYLVQQLGTPDENPTLYHDRSAINFIDDVRRPLLILQGGRDPRVPLAEAEQMRDRMLAAGKTVGYHAYMDEGHGFRKVENVVDAMHRTIAFFDEHMGAS